MKSRIYYHSSTIKRILVLIALILIASLLFYSQKIVNDLREDSTELMNFYAKVYTDAVAYSGNDFSFVFENIIQSISIPMILADGKDSTIVTWKNIYTDEDSLSMTKIDTLDLYKKMSRMDKENNPIELKYGDVTLNYIHYGDSNLIRRLQMLPFVEIGVVALFILLGYFGFQQIRSSEKSSIWAGMAKETAHQLGTPLSSLMGWLAVMESEYPADENIKEMERDVARLSKVTNRFSKIGSIPVLKETEVSDVILEAVNYYKKRLPQLGREINLTFDNDQKLNGDLNIDIFSWAVENLIKNAIDAIGNKDGEIKVTAGFSNENDQILIDVSDNGKGIEKKNWNNIFRPGYSTKRRGWGLGLSLTKRIVEEYHNGRIFVKTSKVGIGTTIRISIPNKNL